MRTWVIVPAAGRGLRFGSALPKQYLPLAGATVLAHTLRRLDDLGCLGMAIGLAPDDMHWPAYRPALTTPLIPFEGGAERAVTVLRGLVALRDRARPDDLVFVHDAARPCVRRADLERLRAAAESAADGALLARPVADTVKREGAKDFVSDTLDRRGLWLAQTPQVFAYARLHEALSQALAAGALVTDEASAIEYLGGQPRLVIGSPDNIKITLPEDLALAELYLMRKELYGGMVCE